MSIKEQLVRQLDTLSDVELGQVAEYVAALKFGARAKTSIDFDEARLAALYAEFAEEDRQLAEEGMEDFVNGLAREEK